MSILRPIILLIASFVLIACRSEPGLDKAKFSDLTRASQDLKTAIKAGKACEAAGDIVQRITAGTTALQGKTASKAESDLLSAYLHLLAVEKDAQLLCQSRSLLSNFPFLPKDRIYVPQELDPIVEKYDLATEKHLYKPTGKYWKSIAADSVSVVWQAAEAEIQHIDNMVKYAE